MAIDKNTENSATRQIDAPAAAIFDILSNPQRHAETDDSGMVVSADQGERLEKVGDIFTMNMTNKDGDYPVSYTHLTLPTKRIV